MDTTSFDYSSAITAHFTYFANAIVATVIFVAIHVMITMLVPALSSGVKAGRNSAGIFLAAMSIFAGLVNAAAMTE